MKKDNVVSKEHDEAVLNDTILGKRPDFTGSDFEQVVKDNVVSKEHDEAVSNDTILGKRPDFTGSDFEQVVKDNVVSKEHDEAVLNDTILGKRPDFTESDFEQEKKDNVAKYLIAQDPIELLKILPSLLDKCKKNILTSNITEFPFFESPSKQKVLNFFDNILNHVEDIKKQALAEEEKGKGPDFTIAEHLTTIEPLDTSKLSEESLRRLISQIEALNRKIDVMFKLIVALCDALNKYIDIKTDNNEK